MILALTLKRILKMQAKDQKKKKKERGRKKREINCRVCMHAGILNKCIDTHFHTLGVH